MLAVAIISIVVSVIVGAAIATRRRISCQGSFDCRGVALQTVIVIVVLLAIAGAVAGVLLSRGGEAVAEAERQDIVRDASEFTDQRLCESYGLTWTGGTCYRTPPVQQLANTFLNKANCEGYVYGGSNPYTWTPTPGDPDPDNNGTCA